MMRFLKKCVLLLLIPEVFGFFKVETENFTVDYIDHKYLTMKPRVYKINQTNALNLVIKLNVNLPETTKINLKGFKLLVDNYWVPIMVVDKSLKDSMEMERFDVQSMLIHHSSPPMAWPLQKDVTYRIQGWTPDTSKYPLNMPEGKWKYETTIHFLNKTNLVILNWYATIANN